MSELKSIKIQGKDYVLVNDRIKAFRETFKDYSLESEVVILDDKICVIKAIIKDAEGKIKATGLAREVNGSSFINKTSYVENCETSAWGRALGNFGIGVDTSIASFEEVANAVIQQMPEQKLPDVMPNGEPIDKQKAKDSYRECVGMIDDFLSGVSKEEWEAFKSSCRVVARNDKWSQGDCTYFKNKCEAKEKELGFMEV